MHHIFGSISTFQKLLDSCLECFLAELEDKIQTAFLSLSGYIFLHTVKAHLPHNASPLTRESLRDGSLVPYIYLDSICGGQVSC